MGMALKVILLVSFVLLTCVHGKDDFLILGSRKTLRPCIGSSRDLPDPSDIDLPVRTKDAHAAKRAATGKLCVVVSMYLSAC